MITLYVLKTINIVLLGYLLLLSLRIILSWFRTSLSGRSLYLLNRLTDPYLSLFRRLRFLRQGAFDFTPIAAILTLVIALDLVSELLYYGRITLGFVLASVLSAVWSGLGFLLLLFCIVGIVRLVALFLQTTRYGNLMNALDIILRPLVDVLSRRKPLGARAGYLEYLILTVGLAFVVWFLGGMGIRVLIRFLRTLPI